MGGPLYGDAGGHAKEPRDSSVLSVLVSGWEGQKGGVDGLHAEAAHDLDCDAEERNVVAGGSQSAGLIFKTDAEPIFRGRKEVFA